MEKLSLNPIYVSNLIKQRDLKSFLPYFNCEESGHESNNLDIVCIDPNCSLRGLLCFRCQYHKHNSHAINCIPLKNFLASVIKNQSELALFLRNKKERLLNLREYMIDVVKDFLTRVIDHFSIFAASVHRFHQIIDTKLENMTIKSDIILHRLFYKKHIHRWDFNDYIKDCISIVASDKPDSVHIKDYVKAMDYSEKAIEDMSKLGKQISEQLEKLSFTILRDIKLEKMTSTDLVDLKKNFIVEDVKEFAQRMMNKVTNIGSTDFVLGIGGKPMKDKFEEFSKIKVTDFSGEFDKIKYFNEIEGKLDESPELMKSIEYRGSTLETESEPRRTFKNSDPEISKIRFSSVDYSLYNQNENRYRYGTFEKEDCIGRPFVTRTVKYEGENDPIK